MISSAAKEDAMTARVGNITFDCDDVLKMATFWSAVLGRPIDLDLVNPDPSAIDELVRLGAIVTAEAGWSTCDLADQEAAVSGEAGAAVERDRALGRAEDDADVAVGVGVS
jgi:hypothetical protein